MCACACTLCWRMNGWEWVNVCTVINMYTCVTYGFNIISKIYSLKLIRYFFPCALFWSDSAVFLFFHIVRKQKIALKHVPKYCTLNVIVSSELVSPPYTEKNQSLKRVNWNAKVICLIGAGVTTHSLSM